MISLSPKIPLTHRFSEVHIGTQVLWSIPNSVTKIIDVDWFCEVTPQITFHITHPRRHHEQDLIFG